MTGTLKITGKLKSGSTLTVAHKVWFDADTSILYGSTTSNTVSDFSIQLTGVAVLETSDVAFYVPAVV